MNKKRSLIHVRLNPDNTERVAKLSGSLDISYNQIVNELLETIDFNMVQVKQCTKEVTYRKTIIKLERIQE